MGVERRREPKRGYTRKGAMVGGVLGLPNPTDAVEAGPAGAREFDRADGSSQLVSPTSDYTDEERYVYTDSSACGAEDLDREGNRHGPGVVFRFCGELLAPP